MMMRWWVVRHFSSFSNVSGWLCAPVRKGDSIATVLDGGQLKALIIIRTTSWLHSSVLSQLCYTLRYGGLSCRANADCLIAHHVTLQSISRQLEESPLINLGTLWMTSLPYINPLRLHH